ncbi:hypothetical protein BDV33DRAFT_199047 [Aspergillus novoparasiticus]|uniref:Uncharacterized protein n=1 Tax=Aspergillus novoparasiticus TaxID=986946 RepID=A0A5N6F6F6_9EURO|nr:hypothetical protein BDV33DRAFT_199047 [Aspergillus novoparasiticus]
MASSLDQSFIISIGDAFISHPDESNTESRFQATTGTRDDAAVFTLTDAVLRSGDWTLSRGKIEDHSLLPKAVYWFYDEGLTQPTSLSPKENDGWNVLNGGASLFELDGRVFAQLLQTGDDEVKAEALVV